MPATVTATGTWTPIPFDVSAETRKTGPNVRSLKEVNLSQFITQNHPETEAVIQLYADGYGIGYQHAALLLRHLLAMALNRYGTEPAADVVT
jgi:hypothetical protein